MPPQAFCRAARARSAGACGAPVAAVAARGVKHAGRRAAGASGGRQQSTKEGALAAKRTPRARGVRGRAPCRVRRVQQQHVGQHVGRVRGQRVGRGGSPRHRLAGRRLLGPRHARPKRQRSHVPPAGRPRHGRGAVAAGRGATLLRHAAANAFNRATQHGKGWTAAPRPQPGAARAPDAAKAAAAPAHAQAAACERRSERCELWPPDSAARGAHLTAVALPSALERPRRLAAHAPPRRRHRSRPFAPLFPLSRGAAAARAMLPRRRARRCSPRAAHAAAAPRSSSSRSSTCAASAAWRPHLSRCLRHGARDRLFAQLGGACRCSGRARSGCARGGAG